MDAANEVDLTPRAAKGSGAGDDAVAQRRYVTPVGGVRTRRC